jgi:hypothetical protein
MPSRQNAEAVKMRRLKKADFAVDFLFMNAVELFPSPVNPEMVTDILPEIEELCQ